MLFTRKYTKGTVNSKAGLFRNKRTELNDISRMSVYDIPDGIHQVYVCKRLIVSPDMKKNKMTKGVRQMIAIAGDLDKFFVCVDSEFLKLSKKQQVALYNYAFAKSLLNNDDIAEELNIKADAKVYDRMKPIELNNRDTLLLYYAAASCGSARAAITAVAKAMRLNAATAKRNMRQVIAHVNSTTAADKILEAFGESVEDIWDEDEAPTPDGTPEGQPA